MLFKICVLIYGYFAGALIQAGYWMGKFNKIDIRDYGSGNAGTTNVMRTLGKKAGIATYLLDAFKAVIADILIHFLIVPPSALLHRRGFCHHDSSCNHLTQIGRASCRERLFRAV